MPKFKLIAHRGYTRHFPENTIVGLGAAIEAGARAVEIDIQLTADQVLVLFHDRDLKRVCGVDGAIHDHTLQQVQAFRASEPERLGDAFEHTKVATLSEFVQLMLHHPNVRIFVEVKRVAIEKLGATTILSLLHRELAPVRKRCVLISFDYDFMLAARRNGWEYIGVILESWGDRNQRIVDDIQPQYTFCNYKKLPKLGSVKKRKSRLVLYEVNDPKLAIKLAKRGADYIETFDIEKMSLLLAKHME
ncbi:MAG: glycerophosphodiester phosphodiesterase family protein [Acidiferrobacterales bacterium]